LAGVGRAGFASQCQDSEFAITYGLCACCCNISTALFQYVVGKLTEVDKAHRWPYASSWMVMAVLLGAGVVLTLVLEWLMSRPTKHHQSPNSMAMIAPVKLSRERSRSFSYVPLADMLGDS
jgi:hypothetical protein